MRRQDCLALRSGTISTAAIFLPQASSSFLCEGEWFGFLITHCVRAQESVSPGEQCGLEVQVAVAFV